MLKKLKQTLVIAVMLALAIPSLVLAEAPPIPLPPIIVHGTVTIDDQTASGGVVSVAGVTANIGSDGKYSISLPYENSGKVVVYEVNGITALATPEIAVSPSGKIDLSVTTPITPTPAPTPPSTPTPAPATPAPSSSGSPSSSSGT